MSPETEALARRAVACKGWRWMPGMLMQIRFRDHPCAPVEAGRMEQRIDGNRPGDYLFAHRWMGLTEEQHDPLPDLTDPATVGCVLALVRERTAPGVTTFCIGSEWTVGQHNALAFDLAAGWHATEAAALVDALEAP